jgi:hypothetical protein
MKLNSRQLFAAARRDFALFCTCVYPSFELPRHLEVLTATLEKVECGEIDRLSVSKPPRHGGTLTTSQLFPCFYVGRHPDRNVMLCTYGQDLSTDLGRRIQNTMQSEAYRAIFPDAALAVGIGSAENIELARGGHIYCTSRAGTATGRGCSALIIDDPLKDSQEAASPVIRKAIQDWYSRVGLTRLTPDGAVIIVSTRWHEDDLAGWVLSQDSEKPWTVLNFSAVAEENDFLGREPGEPLWPERGFDKKYLARRRMEMGARGFVSLYQGHPSEATGNIFKREWMRTYTEVPQ